MAQRLFANNNGFAVFFYLTMTGISLLNFKWSGRLKMPELMLTRYSLRTDLPEMKKGFLLHFGNNIKIRL